MNRAPIPLTPEELLANTAWMRTLARRLVSDEGRAEDVVQETWLAALQRPWRESGAARGWLSSVVRKLASRSHRSEGRLRRREESAAVPERTETSPADLVERAELQRRIVDAVLELKEPYRSTVLWRYFEDLSPSEIARRQGVPVATVWTRLGRAKAELRERLNSVYSGGRGAWQFLILPMAGIEALPEGVAGAGVAPAEIAVAAGGTGSAGAVSSGAAWWTLGGIVMSQKAVVAVGVSGLIALALGFGAGRLTRSGGVDGSVAKINADAPARIEGLQRELAAAQAKLRTAEEERRSAANARQALETQVAALSIQLETHRDESGRAEAARAATKLPLAFGKYAELEGLLNADWKTLAEAAENMNDLFLELMEAGKDGKEPPPELIDKLSQENKKLVQLAAGVMGKIASHSPINGEYAHPVVLSNLVAAMLERAGLSLSDEQREEIAGLGAAYEREYESLQTGYGEGTTRLEKLVDELELRRDFMVDFRDSLSDDQRTAVVHPELQDRMQIDVLSPFTMAIMMAQTVSADDAGAVRRECTEKLFGGYGLD
jgi:RNA polymerase sigma-70 factor (ECF subfamily)